LNICFALQAVPSATPSSFYGSREPPPRAHYEPRILEHEEDLDHWRPGETISPVGRFSSEVYSNVEDSCPETLWSDMKAFISSKLTEIEQSMADIFTKATEPRRQCRKFKQNCGWNNDRWKCIQ